MNDAIDPFNLERFLKGQSEKYASALDEIKKGRKRTHWMWYVFPQIEGLGSSEMNKLYSIKSLAEAEAYLQHPILGPRLIACGEAALAVEGRSAREIFGTPDDWKLKSSATLFSFVSPAGSVFHRILEKFFRGERDEKTIERLEEIYPSKGELSTQQYPLGTFADPG